MERKSTQFSSKWIPEGQMLKKDLMKDSSILLINCQNMQLKLSTLNILDIGKQLLIMIIKGEGDFDSPILHHYFYFLHRENLPSQVQLQRNDRRTLQVPIVKTQCSTVLVAILI